jgi:hypothetical protein
MRASTFFLLFIVVLLGIALGGMRFKMLKKHLHLPSVCGAVSLADKTIESPFTAYGALKAEKIEFKEVLTVYGAAQLDHCMMRSSATFYGAVQCLASEFFGKVTAYGALNAHQTKFHDLLKIAGEATLTDTQAKDIRIETDKEKEPKITLTGTTRVEGSITFAQGNGTVYMQDSAQVQGQVIGGKIMKPDASKETLF